MLVKCLVRFEAETPQAVKVLLTPVKGAMVEKWVPRSLIKYMLKQKDGSGVVHVPKWFAEKNNMDYEDLAY